MTMTIGPQRAAARPTRDGASQEVYDQEIGDGESTRNQAAVDYARRRARSMWADPPDAAPTAPGDAPRAHSGSNRTSTGGRRAGTGARGGRSRRRAGARGRAGAACKGAGACRTTMTTTAEDSPRRKSPAPQVRSTRTAVASAPAATKKDRASARKAARDEDDDDDARRRARPRRNRNGDRRSPRPTRRAARGSTKDDDDDDEDVAPRGRRRNATDDDRRQKANQLANAKDRNGRTASTKGGRDASVTRVAASDARRPTSGKHGRGAAASDGDPKLPPPGRFTVQVGPYRNRKAVEVARGDLSRRGYEAKVVGQSLQLGNFTQKGLADRLATRLRVSGHPATSATLR